ncbi:MAG TPA: hypothetical protein VIS27_09565 [Yeosuana sp.]
MIIKLNKWDLRRAKDFAHNRALDSKLYKSRGNFKYMDNVVGALSEIAAHHYLWDQGIECTEPDFTIYTAENKSYDADLIAPYDKVPHEEFYHIKGQSINQQDKPWARSWLLQKNDPIVKNMDANHFLICTIVDPESLEVEILGKVKLNVLHKHNLFKKPVLEHLQATKVAIYWEDIKGVLK